MSRIFSQTRKQAVVRLSRPTASSRSRLVTQVERHCFWGAFDKPGPPLRRPASTSSGRDSPAPTSRARKQAVVRLSRPTASSRSRLVTQVERQAETNPARRSEDRRQYRPAVREERHQQAQHAAEDYGPGLAVLDVYPDENEALGRQDRGSHHRQPRLPMKNG